jgi:ribosomal protein S27AE
MSRRDVIRRINKRLNESGVHAEVLGMADVKWSNLHDSSCGGRVCLNPAHMGEPEAIAVTIVADTCRRCGDRMMMDEGGDPICGRCRTKTPLLTSSDCSTLL